MEYTCSRGDTWDSIASKAYGDEFLFPQIMDANRIYSDMVMFEGGEKITVPENVYSENAVIASPWGAGNTVKIITAPW